MMKNVLIALSITGLSFASVNAMAGEDFAALDTDQSGTISMSEAQAHTALAEQFKELDADANGELSETELANFRG